MRIPFRFLALLFLLSGLSAHGQSSDNFSYTGPLSASWTVDSGSFTAASGSLTPSGPGHDLAHYNGSFTADQYACTTVSAYTSGDAVMARVRGSNASDGYFVFYSSNAYQLYAGGTILTSYTAALDLGHEYCVIATGTSITVTDNGATMGALSATDSTYSSGNPGLNSYNSSSNAISLWRGGNGTPPTQAATPTISPNTTNPMRVPTGQLVTLACATSGADIYYTSGSTLPADPTTSSTLYTAPFAVTGTTEYIKAMCHKAGLTDSPIALQQYSIGSQAWYVNPTTGGDRYSATNLTGKCNGQSSSAWVSGVNQPCPYSDFRYLWNDPSVYGDKNWVIAGGDTVTISGYELSTGLLGLLTYGAGAGGFCAGVADCYMPSIPSGTSSAHTRILGANYASCGTNRYGGDPAQQEYLVAADSGSYGFMIFSSQYVDVECINVNGEGVAVSGVFSGNGGSIKTAANITLKNFNSQGFAHGFSGPMDGLLTLTDAEFYMNGSSGLDMADDAQDLSAGSIVASYLAVDWNGCQQEWPMTHTIPVANGGCHDESSGGYGDGFATPVTHLDFTCDHCRATYNTQDGFDLTHLINSAVVFTNGYTYGNMGGNFKFGSEASTLSYNNTANANCLRMSEPITGAQTGFNTNLSVFCRAGGDQNTWSVITTAEYVSAASAVGTAVTGSNFSTRLHVGDVVAPANAPFSTYGGRTVTNIADDSHLTVSSAYPANWTDNLLFIPGGTPSSSSTVKMYHNAFVGEGATVMDGGCSFGLQAGGGYAGAPADASYCTGATFEFIDNLVLGFISANCTSGNCGSGTTAPGMFYGQLPTTQDYNAFYNLRASACVGAHDLCATNPLFVSQPALTVPLNSESILDNFNFNLSSSSGVKAAGVTISGQTNGQDGVAWASPPSVGALQFSGTPTAATPVWTPTSPHAASAPFSASLTESTGGAIVCTKVGSAPVIGGSSTCPGGSTLYTGAFTINPPAGTSYAVAGGAGLLDSAAATLAFSFQAAAPTYSPVSGPVPVGQVVALSTASSACSAYVVHNLTNAQSGGDLTGVSTGTYTQGSSPATVYGQVQSCPDYTNSAISNSAYTPQFPAPGTAGGAFVFGGSGVFGR